MSEENANSMASNSNDNGGGYVRKISAQAETDEKPLGRVKDMQRFLMDFERKNKEEAQRHVYQPKKMAAAGPRPWEIKKMEQQEQKAEEKVEEPAVEEEKVEEEPVVEEVGEKKKKKQEVEQQQDIEEDVVDEEEEDDDDEESALDDFASLITTEKKQTSAVAPAPAIAAPVVASAAAPSSPSAASCSTSSLASSQYTRIISKQAEADERPIEPVSELKQWLMQSAPGTDKKNRTLAAAAAAERERAERKLINELSKRMTREEAVKTARSYLRHISDQAVCDELPLMHVSEAQNMLLEFERKNRERIEKHSVKHPNKKMSRTASADEEDTAEEEGASSVMKKMEAAAAEQPEMDEEELSTASGSESEPEDSTVEISLASDGPTDLDESASLNLSIDGVSEKGDEAEEEVADDDDDDSTEMEQPSIDGCAAVESKVEANDDKVDDILEEAVSTYSAVGGPGTVQKLDGISHQQAGLVITYDKSSRSLISESTGSAASSGAVDDTNMPGVDPTDVFRKRYPTDAFEEDVEEAQRPKKLQRGIDMLKCLACPNPVKAMLKDGATAGVSMAKDAKDAMKKVQANLTGNLTMTSSADMEDVAASRRNLGAHAVAAGGYEALESPCDSQFTFDDSVAMSANGIYGIKKPTQFHFTGGNPASGTSGNGYSPSIESESVFSDGLPKTNVLTVAAAGGKPSDSSVVPDHLLWLDGQFGEDRAEC